MGRQMKILFLDDDDIRHDLFDLALLPDHDITHVHTYAEFKTALMSDKFDVIFLDHDLNYCQYESKSADGKELTGYHAAELFKKLNYKPKVIVHSHNMGGAIHMTSLLKSLGFAPTYWEFSPSDHPLKHNGIF